MYKRQLLCVATFSALKMIIEGTAETSAFDNFGPQPYSLARSNGVILGVEIFHRLVKTFFFAADLTVYNSTVPSQYFHKIWSYTFL